MAALISYESAASAVRNDITEAHRRAWERLANPGAWWRGAERVAIAAETRAALDCELCANRKQALTAGSVPGRHAATDLLPAAAVEAIHRIRTDPGRLTESWLQDLLAGRLSDDGGITVEQYVEITGVVVTLVAVDTFAHTAGAGLAPLPTPVAGEPSSYRPEGAIKDVAWVPMIPRGAAVGAESDLYGEGFVPNVRRALSLVPDEVRGIFELGAVHYLSMEEMGNMKSQSRAISREQVELVAARVSALNECYY